MTAQTSKQKMATRRARLAPLVGALGFFGKHGKPSYSGFETAIIDAFERGQIVEITFRNPGDSTECRRFTAQLPAREGEK